MRVAAIQMTSGHDIEANLEAAGRFLEEAARLEVTLAALPENFAFMGQNSGDKRAIAEPDGAGRIQNFLSDTARRLKLWIVGGTVPLRQGGDGRVAAACLVYKSDGQRAARYDKIHLFDVDVPGSTESHRESIRSEDRIRRGGRGRAGSLHAHRLLACPARRGLGVRGEPHARCSRPRHRVRPRRL